MNWLKRKGLLKAVSITISAMITISSAAFAGEAKNKGLEIAKESKAREI